MDDYIDCYYITIEDLKKLKSKMKFKGSLDKFIAEFGFEDMKSCSVHPNIKVSWFSSCEICSSYK